MQAVAQEEPATGLRVSVLPWSGRRNEKGRQGVTDRRGLGRWIGHHRCRIFFPHGPEGASEGSEGIIGGKNRDTHSLSPGARRSCSNGIRLELQLSFEDSY